MVVLPVERAADQAVQLADAVIIPGVQAAVVIVADFFIQRLGQIDLGGMDVLHTGSFEGFFFVKPLEDAAVLGKRHGGHAELPGGFDVILKPGDAVDIGDAVGQHRMDMGNRIIAHALSPSARRISP